MNSRGRVIAVAAPEEKAQHEGARNGASLNHGASAASPLFFLSPRSELAYLQVPKAGCSSIQAALLAVEKPDMYHRLLPELRTNVGKLHATSELLETSRDAQSFLRFTFLRHPLSRLISHYRNQIALDDRQPAERRARLRRELGRDGFELQMSFPDYVTLIVESPRAAANPHVRRQVEIVFGERGINVDFLGRLEEIGKGWSQLQRWSSVPLPALQQLNQSGSAALNHMIRDLEPELLDRLCRHYEDDFRLFGYAAW